MQEKLENSKLKAAVEQLMTQMNKFLAENKTQEDLFSHSLQETREQASFNENKCSVMQKSIDYLQEQLQQLHNAKEAVEIVRVHVFLSFMCIEACFGYKSHAIST